MSFDPVSFGMAATKGFESYQHYQAGKEAQRAYNRQAAEIGLQTAYAQRMALEQMREIGREARSVESAAVAAAGKSGLRVAGSVVTLTQAIHAKAARQKGLIGMQFAEEARRAAVEMDELRRAGRRVKKAGQIKAFGSLLTGGMDLAERKEGLGKNTTWAGLFFPKYRKTEEP